jgi:hypothetical protein
MWRLEATRLEVVRVPEVRLAMQDNSVTRDRVSPAGLTEKSSGSKGAAWARN